MATDKFIIPNIQIGDEGKPGRAFGGLIHGVSASIGKNADPSSLSIEVGLDTATSERLAVRDFVISKADLSLESPTTLKLGCDNQGQGGVTLFSNIFLNGFSKNINPQGKVLSVEYLDGAVLLDRIFVGSLHEHVDSLGPGIGNHPYVIKIPARCPVTDEMEINEAGDTIKVCDHSKLEPVVKPVTRYLKSVNPDLKGHDALAKRARRGPKNIWKGGYILVGKEEFTERSCSLKDVSYNFHDLLNGIEQFGVDVIKTSFTTGDVLLSRNYTGTLRDVLQNWANDLGLTINWDFGSKMPTLVITRTGDINQVEQNIEIAKNYIMQQDSLSAEKSGLVIADYNESFTLNGTYSQAYSSIYNIGPGAKDSQQKTVTEVVFVNEGLDSIGGKTGLYNGRSKEDIYISCALGKYSKELRDIYNVRRGINIINSFKTYEEFSKEENVRKYMPYFEALGFRNIIPLSFGPYFGTPAGQELMENIWTWEQQMGKHVLDTIDLVTDEARSYPNDPNDLPLNVCFFMGFVDDKLRQYTEQLEQNIANEYIGKHYTLQAPYSEIFDDSQCPYQKVLETLKTDPDGKYYSKSEFYKSPMAKFIEKIEDLQVSYDNNSYRKVLYDELGDMKRDIKAICEQDIIRKAKQQGFFYFNRSDAPWATFADDVKNLLNPWTLVADDRLKDGVHNISGTASFRSETLSKRQRKNILKGYTPVLHPPSGIPAIYANKDVDPDDKDAVKQFISDVRDFFFREAKNKGKATGEKPMFCFLKTEPNKKLPTNKIGDLTLDFGGFEYKDESSGQVFATRLMTFIRTELITAVVKVVLVAPVV